MTWGGCLYVPHDGQRATRWVPHDGQRDSFIPRSSAWGGGLGKAWTPPCCISWGDAALHELSILTLEHPSRDIQGPHEKGPGFLSSRPQAQTPM